MPGGSDWEAALVSALHPVVKVQVRSFASAFPETCLKLKLAIIEQNLHLLMILISYVKGAQLASWSPSIHSRCRQGRLLLTLCSLSQRKLVLA